jgi:hypothetical protein
VIDGLHLMVGDGGAADRAAVRSLLDPHVHLPDEDTLRPLVIDGYAAGAKEAQREARAFLAKADTATQAQATMSLYDVDWSAWEPGYLQLAEDLLGGVDDAERLMGLLAESRVTIKSVAENRLGEVARVIAGGIADGSNTRDVAEALAGVLDDPAWSEVVARTETTRVMVAGAFDTYLDAGVAWVSVLSAEDTGVCNLCSENEEAGAVPLWDQPPNGWPPTHPNCRCTVLPASGPNG